MSDQVPVSESSPSRAWQVTRFLCCGIICASVLSCIALAVMWSSGLTQVTVFALDKDLEPRDHELPFFNRGDALPDYRLTVLTTGSKISLGSKPNQSAVNGLTWQLPDPISVSDITSIQLDDQDALVSDAITEVQLTGAVVTSGNYRFEFVTRPSISVGIKAFFKTPIGQVIILAFAIAVVIAILMMFL